MLTPKISERLPGRVEFLGKGGQVVFSVQVEGNSLLVRSVEPVSMRHAGGLLVLPEVSNAVLIRQRLYKEGR